MAATEGKVSMQEPPLEAVAVNFAATVVALRRAARRVVRSDLPELPSSESELLALVGRSKGIGVGEAARNLQVSPNTVSTLIKSLTSRGLIERLSDPTDRRAALLHLTGAGAARLQKIRARQAEVLTAALSALSLED